LKGSALRGSALKMKSGYRSEASVHEAGRFMRLALRLAARGRGLTSPNPLVGAVVVRNGRIVGRGYHHKFGAAHAESLALDDAGSLARGGSLFVNLEPCTHYGHTPPCATKIVESGVKAVFVGAVDPDSRVNGRGIRLLRKHGVAVEVGLLGLEAERLNERYFKWARTGLPFVALKVCESLDGRLAASDGTSRGLGSTEEIAFVQELRSVYDAVLVGSGTVLSDNPRLTVRKQTGRNPHRIVLDSRLKIPVNARVLDSRKGEKVIVAALKDAPCRKAEALREAGVEVWLLPAKNEGVSLKALLSRAAASRIQSVLVEGGSGVATSFIRERLADKMYVALAPKILGGTRGVWPADVGVSSIASAVKLRNPAFRRLGDDLLVEGYF
jgi:diaminohydroxyphosphoribosylaminopyrimidine deaminase/5-amino-6-(5-phosphoribosylamino)uracil reductase